MKRLKRVWSAVVCSALIHWLQHGTWRHRPAYVIVGPEEGGRGLLRLRCLDCTRVVGGASVDGWRERRAS